MKPAHVLDAFGVIMVVIALLAAGVVVSSLLNGGYLFVTGRGYVFVAVFLGGLLQGALLFGFSDVLKHLNKMQERLESIDRRL